MIKRETAGEAHNRAIRDHTRYDTAELSEELLKDVPVELYKCAHAHAQFLDEPEFCVIMQRASDPLLSTVVRKKFYAWLFLPKPRPEQAVFLYNKVTDKFKLLWALPNAKIMAVASSLPYVRPDLESTKRWCDYFFSGNFHDLIRKEHGITLETEEEYLNLHKAELAKFLGNEIKPDISDAFDFSKIMEHKVINHGEVSSL